MKNNVHILKPIPIPRDTPPDLPDYPDEAYIHLTFWEWLRNWFRA